MSEASGPDARTLLDLLAGRARAQALSTAAALGLADVLAERPRSVEELAGALELDAAGLGRLEAVLVGLGACTREHPEGEVALTALGQALRREHLGPLAEFLGAPDQWAPWAALRDRLRHGPPGAFRRAHGKDLYELLEQDDAAARRYDDAIDAFTRHEARLLADTYDLPHEGTLVDVGGGRGATLVELLARRPELRGVLVERPAVARAAGPGLEALLGDRVRVEAGDFLQAVPPGGDLYLLKHVLHNWDDEQVVALLTRCREALAPGGRVLVVEAVLSPDDRLDQARLLDLEMLVLTEGRGRRKPELRRLLRAAGLALVETRFLEQTGHLLVCAPTDA